MRTKIKTKYGWIRNSLILILLIALAFVFLLPLIYMVTSSFMNFDQISKYPPEWIPNPWTVRSYKEILIEGDLFVNFLGNTALITVLSVFGAVLSSSFVAFGFACTDAKAKKALFILLLSTMMIPSTVTMIPTYTVFSKLGWLDTYLPLIVPCFMGGGAFNIFLLRQFFAGIPKELGESARIEGCGWLRFYSSIYMPNARTALLVAVMFAFVAGWNDYFGPLIYLVSPEKYTLSLGITLYKDQFGTTDPGPIMAFSTLSVLPVLVLYCFCQKYFVEGIVTTGIKM